MKNTVHCKYFKRVFSAIAYDNNANVCGTRKNNKNIKSTKYI